MRRLWLVLCLMVPAQAAFALPTAGVTVINNRDYYPAVMRLIEQAQSWIAITSFQARYYEDYPGSDSNNLCDALVAAAHRGVKVTFLVDLEDSDWNHNNDQNADFAHRLAEGGCSVYYDNGNHVSHTKLVVVDGVASVISSVNWSHYALTSNNECAVIVWGPEIAQAAYSYVAEQTADGRLQTEDRPLSPFEVSPATELRGDGDGVDVAAYAAARELPLLPCSDAELLINEGYYPAVKELIDHAERRIDVVQMDASYYRLRPSHAGPPQPGQTSISRTNDLLNALGEAAHRGVDVELTLDGGRAFEEGQPVQNDNLDFALRARSRGCKVWWDSPQVTTHAKFLVIDDDTSIVGSTNWSLFGVEGENNEMSVLMRSPDVASRMEGLVTAIRASGEAFTGEF
jgi:phosphatidylserine/phosphatidylglycerophosphate/cardiolipin synthase-like enzyme